MCGKSRAVIAAQAVIVIAWLVPTLQVEAKEVDIPALEKHVADLTRQLEQATADLKAAKAGEAAANGKESIPLAQQQTTPEIPSPTKIKLGPVTVGGAKRDDIFCK